MSSVQWVKGHSVEKKGFRNYTHPEIMNDLIDELTDIVFNRAIQPHNFIGSDFPFEKVQIRHNGKKYYWRSSQRN